MPSDVSLLEKLPAMVPAPRGAIVCRSKDGCGEVSSEDARALLRSGDVLVAHAAFVSGRLRTPLAKPVYDVLELFAFVHPASPCVPSALGLSRALSLHIPRTPEEAATGLRMA